MAWLALALLFLNALSPAVAQSLSAPVLNAAEASLSEDLLNGRLVICTPTGLRIITLDQDGQPLPDAEKVREGSCPFCPPLSTLVVSGLPLLAAVLPHPEAQKAVPAPVLTETVPSLAVSWRQASPRGPPTAI